MTYNSLISSIISALKSGKFINYPILQLVTETAGLKECPFDLFETLTDLGLSEEEAAVLENAQDTFDYLTEDNSRVILMALAS